MTEIVERRRRAGTSTIPPSTPFLQAMRFSLLAPLLLAVSAAASNVVVLDDGNFDSIVGGSKGTLVEFYGEFGIVLRRSYAPFRQ
jgi:hypothetical protein